MTPTLVGGFCPVVATRHTTTSREADDVHIVLQMDTAGSIPVWVQNMVAPQQAQNVTRIRDSELLGGSARFAND